MGFTSVNAHETLVVWNFWLNGKRSKAASTLENAVLPLQLGLPSSLIRHARKHFSDQIGGISIEDDGKQFENEAFRKQWRRNKQ